MTALFDTPAPRITAVYTGGAALGREIDATLVRVVIEVAPIGRADARLDVRVRPTETGEPFREAEVVARPDQNVIVLGGMQSGEYWDLRVRWVVGALLPGPWATRSSVFVSGYEQAAGRRPPGAAEPDPVRDRRPGAAALGPARRVRRPVRRLRAIPAQPVPGRGHLGQQHDHRALPAGGTPWSRTCRSRAGRTWRACSTGAARPAASPSCRPSRPRFNTFNILLSFSEDPDWAGAHTGTEVGPGGVLQMDGTRTLPVGGFGDLGEVAISGLYDFSTVVDLLTVKKVRVTTFLNSAGANVGETIDDRTSPIDTWTDFDGGADTGDADAQVWVRITDDPPGEATSVWADGTGFTDGTGWTDMSVGGPVWKLYQRLDSAEFEARGYDFQVRLASPRSRVQHPDQRAADRLRGAGLMPTVAVLDEKGLLWGIEALPEEDAAGRVRVPPNIDLPMDGSYWWDPDAQTFLALSQVAALQLSKAPVSLDYVTFLWLQSVVRGTPLPGEVHGVRGVVRGGPRERRGPARPPADAAGGRGSAAGVGARRADARRGAAVRRVVRPPRAGAGREPDGEDEAAAAGAAPMSQHDYNIANATGPVVRQDINDALRRHREHELRSHRPEPALPEPALVRDGAPGGSGSGTTTTRRG